MPSPFPGIDPYVENSEFWCEVHNRLIVAIADYLAPHLRPKYRAAIEKRTYLNDPTDGVLLGESVLVGIADVAVLTNRSQSSPPTRVAALTGRHKSPLPVAVPLPEEIRESYLEIREVAGGRVITVLEILSPKNKRTGVGRSTYERKRQQVLSSDTHLIEIDLLRTGASMPLQGEPATDYSILVSRSHQRPIADLYAFNLQEEIPIFSVPLLPGEPEPEVDLQTLFNAVYDRAGLDLVIDYAQPPIPALTEETAAWAEALLRERGLRV